MIPGYRQCVNHGAGASDLILKLKYGFNQFKFSVGYSMRFREEIKSR
jgi:hypothetical protein